MSEKMTWEKAKGHFKVVMYHKKQVMIGCFHVGLFWQGITHDLSKFSPTEFRIGATYFQGDRSPNAAEREVNGYSTAWLHHKGRNKHHFEYWTDVSPDHTKALAGMKMPPRYLAEMVMDRIAASKAYRKDEYKNDDAIKYLMKGRDQTMMHPETYAELKKILTILAEKGESKTYAYIRKMLKRGYY